ncbi:MAG: hypothetical protein GC190_17520 [Alphaproteobacteria bacterium]|nr:hypothetical protein [Alphaproteobacteria bacterium]
MRIFTLLTVLLLFAVAAAHVYRIMNNFDVIIGPYTIPMMASWVGAAVTGFLGLMVLVEMRR